jgi:hypothetical protein
MLTGDCSRNGVHDLHMASRKAEEAGRVQFDFNV